jgi:hypothetical protein
MEHISSWFILMLLITNIPDGNIKITKKSAEAILKARREDGLQVNTEKTKCVIMFRHKNLGQYHNLLIANKAFENVAKFRYLGTTVTIKTAFTKKLRAD